MKGIVRRFGAAFGKGDLISLQLSSDGDKGVLRVFRNLQPLGVAFAGLPGQTLHAAVSLSCHGQRVTALPDAAAHLQGDTQVSTLRLSLWHLQLPTSP